MNPPPGSATRVAALYDVHGNVPALEAVLAEVRAADVELVVVGGDVVPGPMPGEALSLLESLEVPVRWLFGNGERDLLLHLGGGELDHLPESVRPVIAWCAEQLDEGARARLERWPATVSVRVAGVGSVLFCHATPRSDREIFTTLTPEPRVAPAFEGVDADLVVCGHTHMPFERIVGGVRVVNAGSVGMPFGDPGAYWLLLDGGAQLRRTPFDLEGAARRIRGTAYPQAEAFAAGNVLRPPAEPVMAQALERAAMGGARGGA